MSKNTKRALGLAIVLVSLVLATAAPMASPDAELLRSLDLTEEQVDNLAGLLQEYGERHYEIAAAITTKGVELELELRRPGRLETEEVARESSERTNALVREITRLAGEQLKTRVEYVLKAKDVLTPEQRVKLIASLDFDLEAQEGLDYYEEFNWLNAGLDLSHDQIKEILRYRAERGVKALKIELEIDYLILDLEQVLLAGQPNPQKTNQIITKITDLATQQLDNIVEHFIKTKDVLTAAQKRQVIHMLMMTG
jgi:phenylpyruvate tautomerase PptA (4-oxalocrotonate tautomerase family)